MRDLVFYFTVVMLTQTLPDRGALRILQSNPRYFTENPGKAIYLTGKHNCNDFEDAGHHCSQGDPPPALDYNAFLNSRESHHHNFFRLWRWESSCWNDDEPLDLKHSAPHPWTRTGLAVDGKPKFDLTKSNPEYFSRMREKILPARARGMHVSVMLLKGWEVQFTDTWLAFSAQQRQPGGRRYQS